MKYITIMILTFINLNSYGFVENTGKGYPNCMACHISPNGGGILTNYGRSLSVEFMSTWKVTEGFEKPFYGALENTENITLGGQFRTIQVQVENEQVDVKKQFTMQNNVEFAVKYMEAFLVGTVGTREGPEETPEKGEFLSERHYVLWDVSDDTKIRLGKFRQHFGINHPNHTRFVKSNLGFGSNSESYNLEVSKFYEWGEINTSISIGDFFEDLEKDSSQRNLALNITHYLEGSSRVGLSVLTGKSIEYKRDIIGINGVYSFFKDWILRSEIDYEQKNTLVNGEFQGNKDAIYGDHQIGYQLFQGGLAYFIFEHAQENLKEEDTKINSPGIGFQLLPIPHVELQAEYQRRIYNRDPSNIEHRSFVTLHLYH